MPEQCLHHDENDSGQMRDAEGANVHVKYARQVSNLPVMMSPAMASNGDQDYASTRALYIGGCRMARVF